MAYLLSSAPIDSAYCAELLAEATACTERSGDRFMSYGVHHNAGGQAADAENVSVARAHLEQATQVARAIGLSSHQVSVNLGWALRQEGRPGRCAVSVRRRPADNPSERELVRSRLRQPRPGMSCRGPGRLAPGRRVARCRAGLS
jgi:hypothetical protein